MYSWIRRRVTFTRVGMTFALVFAMSGGAYAASKYVITSTKQIKPSVLKQLQGKTGAAGKEGLAGKNGANGAPGAAGEKGAPGTNGTSGTNGTNGESVASATLKKGEGGCAEGGSKFTASGKETTACNGKEGSPWTAGGTLPAGKTETGVWGVSGLPGGIKGLREWADASISFTIPLAAPLENGHVFVIAAGGKGTGGGTCPTASEAAKPEAETGNLCIFMGKPEINVKGKTVEAHDPATNESGEAATTGTLVEVTPETPETPVSASGTWAVTAP